MKKILTILLFFYPIVGFSQQDTNLSSFVRSIERLYNPLPIIKDSNCFYNNALLMVVFDSSYKICKMQLSDNAASWNISEFERIKRKLDYTSLTKYAKENNFIGKLLFPIVIRRGLKNCKYEIENHNFSSSLFSFNNILLNGNIRFENPIVITSMEMTGKD